MKDELKSLTAWKYFKVAADIFTPGIERSPVESSRTILYFLAGQVLLTLIDPMGKSLSKT